jgi:D-alanyl-D-alanine carboxypeptidase/D-alanyl-D-alanine-endopeptidase (penicillin-binding protein 4)
VLSEIIGKPVYRHSIWGYEVVDQRTGAVLLRKNTDEMFVTGSILKIYAASTALDVLGPGYRFRTPVYRRGRVVRGVLNGNLVLVASGDLSLGLRERPNGTLAFNSSPEIDHNYADTGLPGPALVPHSNPLAGLNQLAKQVRAKGIRHIRGNVVIDDRLFNTYRDWPDGVLSPIWVNENVIDITSKPTSPGAAARVAWRPKTKAIRVESQVRTVKGQGAPLVVDSPSRGLVRIRGDIGARSKPILSIWHIADPAAFARTAFIQALRRAGVNVDVRATGSNPRKLLPRSRSYPRGDRVAERVSPPLSEYVKVILKVSYNRGADDLVCLVAAARGSRNCVDGLKTELATIQRLGVSPVTTILFDGAGSSEYDRSSLPDFTTLLRRAALAKWGWTLHHGLPILGVDGTAATNQKGTPAAGHVFVKSGTRGQTTPTAEQGILSALTQAGYIDAKSGRTLVFAIFLRDLSVGPDFSGFFPANTDEGRIAAAFQEGY